MNIFNRFKKNLSKSCDDEYQQSIQITNVEKTELLSEVNDKQLESIFVPYEFDSNWDGSETEQAKDVEKALSEYHYAYYFTQTELKQAHKYITQGIICG